MSLTIPSAIQVNPWSSGELASAMEEALSLPEDERAIKQQHNYNYALSNTCFEWADTFLNDVRQLTSSEATTSTGAAPPLPVESVISTFNAAKRRVILSDYDGTLTPLVKRPDQAVPPPDLVPILQRLIEDCRNSVYIVSGRDRKALEAWLGHIPVGMSCEHGCFYRPDKWCGEGDGWEDVLKGVDMTWQDAIRPIMEYYAERTPGANVEQKQLNLAWHYRNADDEFGFYQAQELLVQLQNIASKLPVDVVNGNKVIEVKPAGVNKGLVVKRVLNERPEIDFLLCVGDDKTDEDMFAAIDKSNPNHFSVVVGADRPTAAKYSVKSYKEVLSLFDALSQLPKEETH